MYQTMEIYMARKKQVPDHYNPDSNRIFNCDVGDESLGDSKMNKLHINRRIPPPPPHPREPERRNCPHPWHSRFLRHNVRLLNEPVCVMATESTDVEQNEWWPSRTSEEPLKNPTRTLNTTQRLDYQHSAPVRGNTRHSSNPCTVITKGILPVNVPKTKDDPGDLLLERISYNHDYNSRLDRNEPIRGKLHGSFVWNEVMETENGKVVVTPWNRKLLHRCVTVPVAKQDHKKIIAAPSGEKSKNEKANEEKKESKDEGILETKVIVENSTESTEENGKPRIESLKSGEEENGGTLKTEEVGNTDHEILTDNGPKKQEVIPPIDGLPAPSGA